MNSIIKKVKGIPCRFKRCKHPPFPTVQGENMHFNRVHSGKILVKGQRSSSPVLLQSNGHREEVALGMPRKKRKYTRRNTRKSKSRSKSTKNVQVHVCFCPGCGTDILAVAAGLLLKGRATPVKFCPGCGQNLYNVAVGMAADSL